MALQLTIQKIMIFQFSILNFQLKQLSTATVNSKNRYSYSCYSYFSNGSL